MGNVMPQMKPFNSFEPGKSEQLLGLKLIQYFHTKNIIIPMQYISWSLRKTYACQKYCYWNSIMAPLMTSLSTIFKQNFDIEASNTKPN